MAEVNIDIAKESSVQQAITAIQANSTAGVVETVNAILGRVGAHDSVSDETVMGKLNEIKNAPKGTYLTLSDNAQISYPPLNVLPATSARVKISDNIFFPYSGLVKLKVKFLYTRAESTAQAINITFAQIMLNTANFSPFIQAVTIKPEQITAPRGTAISTITATGTLTGASFASGTNVTAEAEFLLGVTAGCLTNFFVTFAAGTQPTSVSLEEFKICYDEVSV